MSYTMCPACGQHALKVANRCPRCGLPFEQQFLSRTQPSPSRRRVPIALVLGGVLILMLGTAEWINRRKAASPAKPAPAAPEDSSVPIPKATPATTASKAPVADSAAPASNPKPPGRVAAVPAPAPAVKEPSPPDRPTSGPGRGESFAATDWVNVRARPNNASAVVGVLQPGELVQVDSTTQGWYLLQAGRVPAGYVDRRLLEARSP